MDKILKKINFLNVSLFNHLPGVTFVELRLENH